MTFLKQEWDREYVRLSIFELQCCLSATEFIENAKMIFQAQNPKVWYTKTALRVGRLLLGFKQHSIIVFGNDWHLLKPVCPDSSWDADLIELVHVQDDDWDGKSRREGICGSSDIRFVLASIQHGYLRFQVISCGDKRSRIIDKKLAAASSGDLRQCLSEGDENKFA